MKIFKVIGRYLKGYVWQFIGVLCLVLCLNYIRSLVTLLISKTFGVLTGDEASTLPSFINNLFLEGTIPHKILIVGIVMVISVIIRDLLNFTCDLGFAYVGEGVGFNMQTDFYNHVQELPYSYLNHAQTGDLIQRSITDANRIKRFMVNVVPMVTSAFMRVIIIVVQMLVINVPITLILLIPILSMLIGAFIYFRKNSHLFSDIEEADGKLTADVQENLTGIRVVKAFANEKYEMNRFQKLMDDVIIKWRRMMQKMSSYYGIMDGVSYFLILTSFVLSIIFVKNDMLTFTQATALFLFVENIIWPTRVLGRQLGELNRSDIASERILEIVTIPTEFDLGDGKKKPVIKGDIEFKDVFFNFADAKTPTIKDINLHIKEGETIALMGKTGCGKSTLVSMIDRMLDCTSGKILIDGVDIKEINKRYIRSKVGLVLQEPFLFSRTIEENIGISLDNSNNDKKVQGVAKIAAVDSDIRRFAEGYNTIVGERGVTLSGGQKQRIAIARTLINFKPIIIFDDSLSAVDTDTDLKIRKAMAKNKKKQTKIIITHRITTAKEADRIVIMDDGKIVDIGSHSELISRPGLYQNIWNIQSHFETNDNKEAK